MSILLSNRSCYISSPLPVEAQADLILIAQFIAGQNPLGFHRIGHIVHLSIFKTFTLT